ncbi:MAG TPA: alanine racemase [Gaiellales bacterium]
MFLEPLRRRNPAFVEAVVALHQAGELPAPAYVVDLDAVEENARLIAAEAGRLGLAVFAMTKQMGRSPAFMAAVRRGGIEAGVAVDMDCARALVAGGMRLGHVGHLVQVPRHEADAAAALEPANWTVFEEAKAAEAAAAARRLGREQALLARLAAPGDTFYPGHEGGFAAEDVLRVADHLDALEGGRFAGVTTFPALLYDRSDRAVRPTPNLATIERAAGRLRASGRSELRVNAPGTTSASVLRLLADAGATQVEPGHGLTGTCPQHLSESELEVPAALYLSEISHHHGGRAYCYGGGLYIDPVFPDYQVRALVSRGPDGGDAVVVNAEIPPVGAIDYHGMLDQPEGELPVGASVVFGFRIQAFFARCPVVAVHGVRSGRPHATRGSDPEGARASEG